MDPSDNVGCAGAIIIVAAAIGVLIMAWLFLVFLYTIHP